MTLHRPLLIVVLAGTAALLVGISRGPLWDEDEPRFAAIARTMVETGDWIVPVFNDTLAVDKPVLMHWCMATCMSVFGVNEFAARLPSMLAALATALAILRLGTRLFDPTTGMVAALAWLGCLLAGIEAHAATPDAILTALCTWATVLAAEVIMLPARSASSPGFDRTDRTGSAKQAGPCISCGDDVLPRLSLARAASIGLLLGLAVVCKGPIGFVGPLAVLAPWAWWVAVDWRRAEMPAGPWLRRVVAAAVPATIDVIRSLRPLTILAATLLAAAPWYVAVWLRTDGAWTEGFFFVHNVGRFMEPMEKHAGSVLFHPLTMLMLFYPWSCFLPLATVLITWRTWHRTVSPTTVHALALLLLWAGVWVGGFSAAATKLPNYVLPAYPALALLVAVFGVDAARRAAVTGCWPHPRWMAAGLMSLAFGGLATAVTVVVTARYGLTGAEPAALVGIVPLVGTIVCWRLAGPRPLAAVEAFAATALIFTSLAVGPAATWMARANTIPDFVRDLQTRDGGGARLGTFMMGSPNVVYYSNGHVNQITQDDAAAAEHFLTASPEAVLLVPDHRLARIQPLLPPGFGEIGRTRPMFRDFDLIAVGRVPSSDRQARTDEVIR
jgi:4-amino-4-deoxy-L-arabinose transferase-like glycosyltransferase